MLKHGNRGITSKSGGADVLEALGVRIDLPPEGFRECLAKAGVGFLFAPVYHPAFKAIMPVRKILAEKGVRTIFNLIGTLLNPARPERQLVGVFNPALPPVYAEILERMGRESAWAVHGTTRDGLPVDELSTMGPTRVCRSGVSVDSGDEIIEPRDFGLAESGVEELQGGDAGKNAEILTGILNGSDTGPRRDIVLLNAGAGLACAGVVEDLKAGVEKARELVAVPRRLPALPGRDLRHGLPRRATPKHRAARRRGPPPRELPHVPAARQLARRPRQHPGRRLARLHARPGPAVVRGAG